MLHQRGSHFRSSKSAHVKPSLFTKTKVIFRFSPISCRTTCSHYCLPKRLARWLLAYLAGRHASFNINSPCDSPLPSNLNSNTWGHKEKYLVCSLTLRYALAPAIGHRHTHPQSEALTLLGPGTVMKADSWYTLPLPSTALRKPLPYSHFDTAHLLGPQPSAKDTFFPPPKSSLTGIVRPLPEHQTRGSLLQFLL